MLIKCMKKIIERFHEGKFLKRIDSATDKVDAYRKIKEQINKELLEFNNLMWKERIEALTEDLGYIFLAKDCYEIGLYKNSIELCIISMMLEVGIDTMFEKWVDLFVRLATDIGQYQELAERLAILIVKKEFFEYKEDLLKKLFND